MEGEEEGDSAGVRVVLAVWPGGGIQYWNINLLSLYFVIPSVTIVLVQSV